MSRPPMLCRCHAAERGYCVDAFLSATPLTVAQPPHNMLIRRAVTHTTLLAEFRSDEESI